MPDERRLQFGHPEFWWEAVIQHRTFYAVGPRLQAAINGVTCRAYDDLRADQSLILNLAMMAGVGTTEVITLVGNGMGQGAMKIVRNVLETAINMEYIRRFPEQAQLYLDWHWVEVHKLNAYMEEYLPDSLARMAPEQIAANKANYQRVKDQFRYSVTRPDGSTRTEKQRTWCRDDLSQRATKTGFAELYATAMPQANQILHGSIGGLLNHMGSEKVDGRIDCPPSHSWAAQALIAVHGSMIQVVQTAGWALNVGPEPSIESLMEDYMAAWGDEPPPKRGCLTKRR